MYSKRHYNLYFQIKPFICITADFRHQSTEINVVDYNSFCVDPCPVVFHRNGYPVIFVTEIVHFIRFFDISVFALCVIAAEHECKTAVIIS